MKYKVSNGDVRMRNVQRHELHVIRWSASLGPQTRSLPSTDVSAPAKHKGAAKRIGRRDVLAAAGVGTPILCTIADR